MAGMFDPDCLSNPRRPGQRGLALTAVVLFVLSCSLLGGMAAESGGRVQTLAWVFGPAPAAADTTY